MKKVLTILFVLLIFDASFAKLLTNAEVSLEVPEQWSDNISNSESNLIISVSLADDDGDFKENVVVTKERLPKISLSEYKNTSLETLKSVFSLSVVESKENYLVISHRLPNNTQVNQLIYFYIKNDNGYCLIFSAATDDYKKLFSSFYEMQKSFKIQ